MVIVHAVPLGTQADRTLVAFKLLDELADDHHAFFRCFGLSELGGDAVEQRNIAPAAVNDLRCVLFVGVHILLKRRLAATALRKDRLCFEGNGLREYLTIRGTQQHITRLIAHFTQRTGNRRQRRGIVTGVIGIVESGDDDILRDLVAVLFESTNGCKRHCVIGTDDGIGHLLTRLDELQHSRLAVLRTEFAEIDTACVCDQPVLCHDVQECLITSLRLRVGERTGNEVDDLRFMLRDNVLDQFTHRPCIIDLDVEKLRIVVAIQKNRRNAGFLDRRDDLLLLTGVTDRICHQNNAVKFIIVYQAVDIVFTNVILARRNHTAECGKARNIRIMLLGTANNAVNDAILVFFIDTGNNDCDILDFCHGLASHVSSCAALSGIALKRLFPKVFSSVYCNLYKITNRKF